MNFSHFDTDGNAVMVDVSEKDITKREAIATGHIHMSKECFKSVKNGGTKKGDVLGVAQVAGIMACKRTSELIPLSHSINLTNSKITFTLHDDESTISAICTVCCDGKTGVEMEALTGVSIALLTIYDMCKAIDKSMEIGGIHLVEKSGGKSGHFQFDKRGSLS
jgi:cyclic pyranopterin phosphate synthase